MPRMTAFLSGTVSRGHGTVATGGGVSVTALSIGRISSWSCQARRNLPHRSCSGVRRAAAERGMRVSVGGRDGTAGLIPQGGDDALRDASGVWSARLETAKRASSASDGRCGEPQGLAAPPKPAPLVDGAASGQLRACSGLNAVIRRRDRRRAHAIVRFGWSAP